VSAGPSLYRRHRPRTFADVVGQEHVVRTLRNAIEQDKVHHAYLFVGSRGTGKTSMAKILAACLNCVRGPTAEPCGVCDSCVAIAGATSLDVIEMDAASNNSVDDIRELRESVQFAPVSGRSKVYILDEAHMLSSQAWNAFLKTLEEPPPHTIFVLATTEAQKVLPTVVDRCHRFDFGRPTVEQLAAVVQRVAGRESIEIAPDAVALLARHATGSFRDALGTLEQLVTYSGASIAMDDVLAVLGVADADLLFATLDAIAAHDSRAALHAAAALADTGRDLGQFTRDLEAHARDLLVVQTLGEVPPELRLTPDRDARLAEQAERIGGADVVRLLDLLAAAMRAVKDGASARTQLELALVKAAAPEVDPAARALMARIERLEAALDGRAGAPPAPVAAPAAPPAAPPAAAPEPPPAAPEPPASASPAPEASAELRFDAVAALWPSVLDAVRSENGLLGACLSEARPVELRGRELVVAFAAGDGFNRKLAEGLANRAALEAAVRDLAGGSLRVAFELRDLGDGAAVVDRPQSEDELLARLVAEFDAEEIVPDPDHERGEA
jgi:DNA polymerase-3 subunit gamma/tau